MKLLEVGALTGPGLAGDHPGEVEAEDLPTRLRERIVGQDAGRLPDDEARPLGLRGRFRRGPLGP
jgi:hypothetical protein